MYLSLFKRLFDLIFVVPIAFVLFPIFIIVYFLIKFDSSGPVFFLQERLGINQEKFEVIKFRTMTNKPRNVEEQVYNNNPEVTKIGKWLRRYKIDELPQIINVLKGDMSVIGPRPCLPGTPEKFNLSTEFRFLVKPGLSSIAGVNGSIYLSWEEKWWYDEFYVKNVSFLLDLKIIIKTILVMFIGEDKFVKRPKLNQNGD